MYKKRGQITVFVIIGLIVLLTYFLLSYYKKETIEERELIQPELIPVQQYVETCTRNLGREAIETVGLNGGYIYFPPRVENNPMSYLQLGPIDELKNPYWRYEEGTATPSLEFISDQISTYVEKNIERCIDNFSAFYNKYNIIELGDFEVTTKIAQEDVMVETVYPIEVQDKFNKTLAELQKYIVVVPIRLQKVHELASKIIERDNNDYFIENKVIDLMSLAPDEIPITGLDVDCGKIRWQLADVKNRLSELLQYNLPYVKVRGTNFDEGAIIPSYPWQDVNPYSSSDIYSDSYYGPHYIWDVSDVHYPNMHVSFTYDNTTDIMLYARPNKGRHIESTPHLCFHTWHFTYDIIFPVMVTIVDDATDNNEEYAFNYAFKAQINHNEPDVTNFAITTFDTRDIELEEDYCGYTDKDAEATINVNDKISGEAISNVNLTLTCGRYTCRIGHTEIDWSAEPPNLPYLKKKLPYCANGILRGSAEDYEDNEMFIETGRKLGTNPNEMIGKDFTLWMRPTKTFNVSVVKHRMTTDVNGEYIVGGGVELDGGEKAGITLTNKDDWEGEFNAFESYASYPSNETNTLKLLMGSNHMDLKYDLDVYITDSDGDFVGGYVSEWVPDSRELRLRENLVFHVVEMELEGEEEQYLFYTALNDYSARVPLPEIK